MWGSERVDAVVALAEDEANRLSAFLRHPRPAQPTGLQRLERSLARSLRAAAESVRTLSR